MTAKITDQRRSRRTIIKQDWIDANQQQKLVKEHMGLARYFVGRHMKNRSQSECSRHYDDLMSQAYLGLCVAAKRFNPGRGFQFSTYATFWIRSFIQRYFSTLPREGAKGGDDGWKMELFDRDSVGGWSDDEWHSVLCWLPTKHRQVIEARFRQGLTLTETGELIGVTRERVRQLESRALEMILDRATLPI